MTSDTDQRPRTGDRTPPVRLLTSAAALFWGLQFAFLNPALALLLTSVFDADAGQVGLSLAIYNASGFVASLVLPALADRRGNYLRPMFWCGVLTLALSVALMSTTSLPWAVVALVVLGGPAGVGNSLLFAHLRHSGASPSAVVNTRSISSFAWVAGPPLATLVIASFGDGSVLALLAGVSVLTIVTSWSLLRRNGFERSVTSRSSSPAGTTGSLPKGSVGVLLVAFVLLQATNAAAVSVLGLFVTRQIGLGIGWSGVALGVTAALEIPALLLIGRLLRRTSVWILLSSGALAGAAYYLAMVFVTGPVVLLAIQLLNAWFCAVVAGVGLTVFQDVIPRPGLASGLFLNTRRAGAVISGAVIAFAGVTTLEFRGVFLLCAAMTVLALVTLVLLRRATLRPPPAPAGPAC